jgi:hypothetical protein
MLTCIFQDEYNSEIHEIISGPHDSCEYCEDRVNAATTNLELNIIQIESRLDFIELELKRLIEQ